MSTGTFTVLDIAALKIGAGTIDLDSHSFKCRLTTDAQALSSDFAGSSGDARASDLTAEVSDPSYSAQPLSVSWTRSGAVSTFDGGDTTYPALNATFKYAVITDESLPNKDILGFFDFNASGGSINVAGVDYIIQWADTGIFTLSRS